MANPGLLLIVCPDVSLTSRRIHLLRSAALMFFVSEAATADYRSKKGAYGTTALTCKKPLVEPVGKVASYLW